mmetsp:Transcript_14775/g.32614  ORF Transcript_14775/g.32614 Transcript_14775/m.32614 type:complete len:267 (+) Transcript_14775:1428-2228(+)
MRQSCDSLHLDSVALLQRSVQNTRRVYDLPAKEAVVHVAYEEGLGGEGVGLHVHVCAGHLVHERGLAHVGVAGQQQCAGVGVQGRQTRDVLAHLLEIAQGCFELLQHCAHATHGCALELLTPVERVSVLQQAQIVLRKARNQVLSSVHLSQGELEVVSVVQDVHKVCVEGVDVVQAGEVLQHRAQFLANRLLREFDLTHVEVADARDLVARVDDGGCAALRAGEHDVDHLHRAGNGRDFLKVVDHHDAVVSLLMWWMSWISKRGRE